MDFKSFELLYHDAVTALTQKHLLDGLTCIRGIIFNVNSIELNRELESLQQDYKMMLGFMQQGGTDPERAKVYRTLSARAFSLLDKSARLFEIQNDKNLYGETARKYYTETASIDNLIHLHNIPNERFEWIWTSPLYRTEETDSLKLFLETLNVEEQAQSISAIMLNLMHYFDPKKFKILLHYCRVKEDIVRVRAITAAVLVYMQYHVRFLDSVDLHTGLTMLIQEPTIKEEFILLQRQLLLSLETAKAEKKLQKEIFPDLLKNRNFQRDRIGLEQMEEDIAKVLRGEPNAEWEKMGKDKHLADNMMKIISMGKEGVDINIGTFSGLKNFAFFQQTANWFAPFNAQHPDVKAIFDPNTKNNPINMLMEAGGFCDSDKYSLCLMLTQIPQAQRDMMATQIGSQMDGAEEQFISVSNESKKIIYIYRSYLQDLYRFFKLNPNKSQFEDPFKKDLLFTRYTILENMLKQPDYLMDMASFLIKRECYQDAITYIEEVLKTKTANAEMLQKIAFCHQHTNNFQKAIYYYQQADLLNPDNEWILKQMYLCYSALGRYEQELECLKNLEAINPGDVKYITEIGLCLIQLGCYEEAAKRFYELEYKGERVLSSWRAIAWCNFKMDKLEQADKYYCKIMQHEKATWEDFLNAGHTAWCRKETNEAISRYKKYLERFGHKRKDVNTPILQPFDDDTEELIAHGIERLEISLMRDILQPQPDL